MLTPDIGQGMNASMNDTHNLGMYTLSTFLCHSISVSLSRAASRFSLETSSCPAWLGRHVLVEDGARLQTDTQIMSLIGSQYEFERRKYAQDLIDFDKKFSKLFSGKPRTEANQDGVSHEEFLEYVVPRALPLKSTFSLLSYPSNVTNHQGIPDLWSLLIRHWGTL